MEMSYRQPGPQNVIQTYSGLVMNGLVPNGLVPNGLDPNGLGNGEPERAEMGAKRPISQRVLEILLISVQCVKSVNL